MQKLIPMYVYNLTLVIDANLNNQWLNWLESVYLPKVYATRNINSVRIFKILSVDTEITYAIHHETESPRNLLDFTTKDIPELQALSFDTFADKVLMFGTQLKEVIL